MQHPDNNIFIERTKLCMSLGRLADARHNSCLTYEEVVSIGDDLKKWSQELPQELQLHKESEKRSYRHAVSELHIMYHVCNVLCLQSLAKVDANPSSAKAALEDCVRSASRIVRLFEEIWHWNEVLYLGPINNWFCYLAGVIRIQDRPILAEERTVRDEELEIVKTILMEMAAIAPSSTLILRTLERLEQSTRTVPERPTIQSSNLRPANRWPEDRMENEGTVATESSFNSYDQPNLNNPLPNGEATKSAWMTPVENWAFDSVFDFSLGDIQFDT